MLCVACTIVALHYLELSVAWAVFTALELLGTISLGIVMFGEQLNWPKLAGILTCLAGSLILALAEEELLPEAWMRPIQVRGITMLIEEVDEPQVNNVSKLARH